MVLKYVFVTVCCCFIAYMYYYVILPGTVYSGPVGLEIIAKQYNRSVSVNETSCYLYVRYALFLYHITISIFIDMYPSGI